MQAFSTYKTSSYAFICVGFIFVLFLAGFQVFDSPETWLDEGLIIQSAMGLLETGKASLPVAPDVYEPAWYITTGFPVTIPLAAVFALFGTSIVSARIVMLLFILCFYSALFIYIFKTIGGRAAYVSFLLLVFFAPIYGHGRNVLGEVPGLFFILLTVLVLPRAGALLPKRAFLIGMGTGLAVATKPIFILFALGILIALIVRRKELRLKDVFVIGMLGFCIPIFLWLITQFDSTTIFRVLSVYANPHDVNILNALIVNAKRLCTEGQPLYVCTKTLSRGTNCNY
jgi:4-amino-4-deoxy-L-arabinose transferase-like glycosyltransferase